MHPLPRLVLLAALVTPFDPVFAAGPKSPEELEAAVRLQVFLDKAQFAPGKIDGEYGEFTLKALSLYREATGTADKPAPPAKTGKETPAPPDVSGLDLAGINPVFIPYAVTEADLQSVGELAASVPEQARQKSMPYRDLTEAVAEKFHCAEKLLHELNPGMRDDLKAGDTVKVPNVPPFDLAAVKDMKLGGEDEAAKPSLTSVKVDTRTNMLSIRENGRLVTAFPVTVGSAQTESPEGDWKVKGFEKMPTFRYDAAMLKRGERSNHFHLLPPGPNNPVGVMWIQLSKKGIGLHGTDDPETIGRAASHGCVRLANWDVVRLATRLRAGVPVEIH